MPIRAGLVDDPTIFNVKRISTLAPSLCNNDAFCTRLPSRNFRCDLMGTTGYLGCRSKWDALYTFMIDEVSPVSCHGWHRAEQWRFQGVDVIAPGFGIKKQFHLLDFLRVHHRKISGLAIILVQIV